MEHGFIVLRFLFPADLQAPESVKPGVGTFDDPAARPLSARQFFVLLTSGSNVGAITQLPCVVATFFGVIGLVTAEMVKLLGLEQNRILEGCSQELTIVPIGGGHQNRDRNAGAIRKQASLGPSFAAIRGVWPGFFPHPAELSSSRRRYSASPT